MPDALLTENMQKFLLNKEFISVGTCDFRGRPNAAPKFVVKVDDTFIYLADYVIGTTFENLKSNPRVSLSTVDMKTLEGYRINGIVKILTRGPEYKKLLNAMIEQQVHHSARRIVEDVRGVQKYDTYEVALPEKVVIFKIECEHITKISTAGKLYSKRVKKSV